MSEPDFTGVVGRTVAESAPAWAEPPAAGRPNVVLILLDDVGFGQLGCYGSEIATPNIDRLAQGALRYTNFHVTPMCSPTRASLLTGRNHHSVGVGYLADFDTGYPGYRGRLTPHAATVAEMLGNVGYGCYAVGKWHLAPPDSLTSAGPFTHWPTRRGFDRWYGFLWGEDDQWHPELWEDQHLAATDEADGRHLSEKLVDRSCGYLGDHLTGTPDRPFLLYLALGACHAPHQAPQSYLNPYRGRFDAGWDIARREQLERQLAMGVVPSGTTLPPRNPDVPAWNDLAPREQRQCARLQEAFAGFMTHTDAQVGRLLQYLVDQGIDDNTMIIFMSDNGASGEGGRIGSINEYRYFLGLEENPATGDPELATIGSASTHNHYPSGWAQAGNTPLKYYKKHTYGGGVRVPFIVRPPSSLRAASDHNQPPTGFRRQFHHAIDVLPTILDLTGATAPTQYHGLEQLPLHGTSMRYSFEYPEARSTRRRQYFEMGGQRGIWADGWKAVAMHEVGQSFDADQWELFHLDEDFAEIHDLGRDHPELLTELQQAWWQAAEEYGVLPLDDRAQARVFAGDPRNRQPQVRRMLPGSRVMSAATGVDFGSRPFEIDARLAPLSASSAGVLLAHGRRAAGFALYVQNSRLCFDYNLAGDHTLIGTTADSVLNAERLGVIVARNGSGTVCAELVIDGVAQGGGELPQYFPAGFGTFSTQCGHNGPSAVSNDYPSPFRFGPELRDVTVRLGERDDAAAESIAAALRQQ